jgi:putative mycofactocin binding protein MftB
VPATATDRTLDLPWELAPQVAVRPEPFGALLYHFGTRQLSFLKDRRLLAVVEGLATADTARAACSAAGIADGEIAPYAAALQRLVETDMVRERQR